MNSKMIAAALLAATAIAIGFISPAALQGIIGTLLIFFLPGNALLSAIYPLKQDLGLGERITFSIILSFVSVILLGFVMNLSEAEFDLQTMLAVLVPFIIAFYLLGAWLKRRLGEKSEETNQSQNQKTGLKEFFCMAGSKETIVFLALLAATIGFGAYLFLAPFDSNYIANTTMGFVFFLPITYYFLIFAVFCSIFIFLFREKDEKILKNALPIIILICAVALLLYLPPRLYSNSSISGDPLGHYTLTSILLEEGHFYPELRLSAVYFRYPGQAMFFAFYQTIANLDPVFNLVFTASVLVVLGVAIVFLLAKRYFGTRNALIAALIYAMAAAGFTHMCPFMLAIVLGLAAFYFAMCYSEQKRLATAFLLSVFLIAVAMVITHTLVIQFVALCLFAVFIVSKIRFIPLKKINIAFSIILVLSVLGLFYVTTFDVRTFDGFATFYFRTGCIDNGAENCFDSILQYVKGGYSTKSALKQYEGEKAELKPLDSPGRNIESQLGYAFNVYLLFVSFIGLVLAFFKKMEKSDAFFLFLIWGAMAFFGFLFLQYGIKVFSERILFYLAPPLAITSAHTILALRQIDRKKIAAVLIIGFVLMSVITPFKLYSSWRTIFVFPENREMGLYLADYATAKSSDVILATGSANPLVWMMLGSKGQVEPRTEEFNSSILLGKSHYDSQYFVMDVITEDAVGRKLGSYEKFREETEKFDTRMRADKIYDSNFSSAYELLAVIREFPYGIPPPGREVFHE